MGAIVHDAGVAFRLWAPNADAVFVTGDFNDWSEDATPMAPEQGGTCYADVADAKPGDEYRFLIRNGDAVLSRIDPYACAVTTSVGNAIVVDPRHDGDDGFEPPPWNELVIYEMHIDTFSRPDEDTGGTFEGAIERLGHLRRLGVNAVQIMPAMEFAGDVSWGYNPAHIFAVESTYGGPEGLRAFIEAAHRSGIAVILDVVYNHFGPSDLDLWQFDGWSETTRAASTSTTTGGARRPGATPGPTTGGPRSGSSSRTTRSTG
jgi:1,4-alpha-glucan branching enzyme